VLLKDNSEKNGNADEASICDPAPCSDLRCRRHLYGPPAGGAKSNPRHSSTTCTCSVLCGRSDNGHGVPCPYSGNGKCNWCGVMRGMGWAAYFAVAWGAVGGAGGRDTCTSGDGTDSSPLANAVT